MFCLSGIDSYGKEGSIRARLIVLRVQLTVGGLSTLVANPRFVMKRLAIVTACFLIATGSPASARDDPYFESHTDGTPASTLVGQWVVDPGGRSVHLELHGGHAAGARTWFRAGWLTPWTTAHETARFEGNYEFSSLNQLGETIRFTISFRFRDKGEPWSRWMPRDPFPIQGGSSGGMGGGSIFESGDHRPMRFEWKIRGVLRGPASLDGTIELSVN